MCITQPIGLQVLPFQRFKTVLIYFYLKELLLWCQCQWTLCLVNTTRIYMEPTDVLWTIYIQHIKSFPFSLPLVYHQFTSQSIDLTLRGMLNFIIMPFLKQRKLIGTLLWKYCLWSNMWCLYYCIMSICNLYHVEYSRNCKFYLFRKFMEHSMLFNKSIWCICNGNGKLITTLVL